MKHVDDFIVSLIRHPAFPSKVNDIVVECGNSLYQPLLDRYIAGEDVAFAEVRATWRNTTQPMCSMSGFYQQLFPLVRRINAKLPSAQRLRVLAGDPPIDWDAVKTQADWNGYLDRDVTTTAVMEKEVLSRHRKALMLFGVVHLFHRQKSAVSEYEKTYPGVTYVIAPHIGFGNGAAVAKYNDQLEARLSSWPVPSLASIRGSWLADLGTSYFLPPPISVGSDCKIHGEYSEEMEKGYPQMVDGFLYLGPQSTQLEEPTPASIALDGDYMKEMRRRMEMLGFPVDELEPAKVVASAANPFTPTIDLEALKKEYAPVFQGMIDACLKK